MYVKRCVSDNALDTLALVSTTQPCLACQLILTSLLEATLLLYPTFSLRRLILDFLSTVLLLYMAALTFPKRRPPIISPTI